MPSSLGLPDNARCAGFLEKQGLHVVDVNCEQRETGEADGAGGRCGGGCAIPTRICCDDLVVVLGLFLACRARRREPTPWPPPCSPRFRCSKRLFFMEGFVAGDLTNEPTFKRELRELKSARACPPTRYRSNHSWQRAAAESGC